MALRNGDRIPIALFVDDGSPVDPLFYEIPGYETEWLVPAEFTRRFAELCERFELRGKFTVIPMPSCLGRIDQSLRMVPSAHLEEFLRLMRDRIAPRFDITPEFLTHLRAYDLTTGSYQHRYEDLWLSSATLEEATAYFELAFQILDHVALAARGITSPWKSGHDVEKKYARALADAQWNAYQRPLTWYFLHASEWEQPLHCSVTCQVPERGQQVVSVPANTGDIFWCMDLPTHVGRVQHIRQGIDRLLSADGRSGRLLQLLELGFPIVLLTHWQSLYAQGTGLGLEGLCALAERIEKVFGDRVEWSTCTELVARHVTVPP